MPNTTHRLRLWAWMAFSWVSWVLLEIPFNTIRGLGDNISTPHDVAPYERAMFAGTWPTTFLQEHLYARDMPWLDYCGYVAHGLWFGVPFAFGIVLMIYQRERLFEFLMWINVLVYTCAASFAFFPARPPWMEPGIVRIMAVRNAEYLTLDPNPTAAFPSLHAALPMAVALFFFLRCRPKLRFYGWLVLAYTFVVSFAIVYLGEHWVIDVLGGWAAAGATAYLCMSASMHRLYSRLPGNPVGRVAALNARICAPAPPASAEEEPEDVFEPVPQAA